MKVVFTEPKSLAGAVETLKEAIRMGRLVVVIGRCRVDYEGRGSSRLSWGERMLIVKQDGSILVHRPHGYSPVNWQPETSSIHVDLSDDGVRIVAVRARPREVVKVLFDEVYGILACDLVDEGEFVEYLSEREIRDYIMAHPDLIEEGLRVIKVERPVEPGFIDLYCIDRNGNLVVIEVKRVTADTSAVRQLLSYVEALRHKLRYKGIRGILVAPGITRSALDMLNRLGFEFKRIDVKRLHKAVTSYKLKTGITSIIDYLGWSETGSNK